MRYAILDGALVVNVIRATPEYAAQIGAVECPPEVGVGWQYTAGQWTEPTVTSPVPKSVPAHHIRRALSAAGLRASVEAAIAALPEGHEMRDDWKHAPYIRRDSIGVETLRAGLGLTHAQIDDVFRAAGAMLT